MDRSKVILLNVRKELLKGRILRVIEPEDPAHLDHLPDLLFERQLLQRSIRPPLLRPSRAADGVGLQGLCLSRLSGCRSEAGKEESERGHAALNRGHKTDSISRCSRPLARSSWLESGSSTRGPS